MSKPFIFISCGQFTDAEKALGKAIVKAVEENTDYDAYFAEEGQDLDGLDNNILNALQNCVAFITVLHPRGEIFRPNGTKHVRASVWIEQEIAIATYIKRVQKKSLPVIAFIYKSAQQAVGREGIRELIKLNPIQFADESEVLAVLPERLKALGKLTATDIVPEIRMYEAVRQVDKHITGQLLFRINNNTDSRIEKINGKLRIHAGLLKHHTGFGMDEELSPDRQYRILRFNEANIPPLQPQSYRDLPTFEYCRHCAIEDTHEPSPYIGSLLVSEYEVEMTLWVDGKPYHVMKTIKELGQEANARQARA
jgi:hypothetical protein